MIKKAYVSRFFQFTDKIVSQKRNEIFHKIIDSINLKGVRSILDVGTTSDNLLKSSNYIIYKFKNIEIKKSLSDQKLNNEFFNLNIKKSITKKINTEEIKLLSSDIVISSATIEHVGNNNNKKVMIRNMSLLAKKYFILTTPNRFYPIDFHTKLPLIHFLPKKIHRSILRLIGMKFFSYEENLDLLSYNELLSMMSEIKDFDIEIKKIKLLGLTSNYIIIEKKKV